MEVTPDQWLPEWLEAGVVDTKPCHAEVRDLTKFEVAALIGTRAAQLSNGSDPRVAVSNGRLPLVEVAKAEIQAQQLPPWTVMRYLPDGQVVEHSVSRQT